VTVWAVARWRTMNVSRTSSSWWCCSMWRGTLSLLFFLYFATLILRCLFKYKHFYIYGSGPRARRHSIGLANNRSWVEFPPDWCNVINSCDELGASLPRLYWNGDVKEVCCRGDVWLKRGGCVVESQIHIDYTIWMFLSTSCTIQWLFMDLCLTSLLTVEFQLMILSLLCSG